MSHSISDLQAAINFVQNTINTLEHKIYSGITIANMKGLTAESYTDSEDAKAIRSKINELLEKNKQLKEQLDDVIKEKFNITI